MSHPRRGLLLIGHGTRDPRGLAEFRETVQRVADSLPSVAVGSAFLELAQPDIADGVHALALRGVEEVTFVPLLLFAAGHAKRDIPAALDIASRQYAFLRFGLAEPLGCHPSLLELSAQRFREALADTPRESSTLRLILVGRGSSDATAAAETEHYAGKLAEQVSVPRYHVAFMAAASPRLGALLDRIEPSTGDWLVFQPHLLFHGEVLADLNAQVAAWGLRCPVRRWSVAEHLGPSRLLVQAIIDRFDPSGTAPSATGSLDKDERLD
jgi:sirohydrochlorin cobaltochelatase